MKKIADFIKNETVLSVAVILAVFSAFFVRPDREYLNYIDFRTLSLLFCLMAVIGGMRENKVFDYLAFRMFRGIGNTNQMSLILVMLCFFFSMLITNDVALITFVPFTFIVLDMTGKKDKLLIPTVAMQTVAANLGSMLTPVGNPQNLYLYGKSGMSILSFMSITAPYTLLSLVMLLIWSFRKKGEGVSLSMKKTVKIGNKRHTVIYALLFLLSLFTVAKAVPYYITLVITALVVFITDRKVLKTVDYSLLVTFVGFFVFIGNMGRIDAFRNMLQSVIAGREVIVSAAASQVISNVPAALLLSGFTDNIKSLVIGTNIGGLGTLIASMASLISFKYIAKENKGLRGRYILYFTAVNIIFLAALLLLYGLMSVL